MSDKLFPDDKKEYEYEENERNRNIKEELKNLIDSAESFLSSLGSEDDIEAGLETRDHSSPSSTGLKIDGEEEERSFTEKAGLSTYVILGIELVLVTYFVLALLGFVPMF
jgi:hypothetical protein